MTDPLNRVETWRNSPAFQDLFTEDLNTSFNDRFDMQLTSSTLLSGTGLDYKPGTYRVVGNNGTVAPGGVITPSGTLTAAVAAAIGEFSERIEVVNADAAVEVRVAGDARRVVAIIGEHRQVLAQNFGKAAGQSWLTGDLDDDRGVSINDFNLLAGDFARNGGDLSGLLAFAAAHNDLAAFVALTGVPEPTGLAALGVAMMAAMARRR